MWDLHRHNPLYRHDLPWGHQRRRLQERRNNYLVIGGSILLVSVLINLPFAIAIFIAMDQRSLRQLDLPHWQHGEGHLLPLLRLHVRLRLAHLSVHPLALPRLPGLLHRFCLVFSVSVNFKCQCHFSGSVSILSVSDNQCQYQLSVSVSVPISSPVMFPNLPPTIA